ncbi:hypothetical protein [Paraburkholderia sediminicola]|uniref:hypothetical protein n=1 Tax=Paraburkholderia sediminicola TaxID=458836 RepID=UPI0038B830DA
MKTVAKAVCCIALVIPSSGFADCVIGAKSKTTFSVLDSHTVILKGGYGPSIIVKTLSFVHTSSSLTVLKDDFCSSENAVLYIDGDVADAGQVTKID